MLTQEMLKSRIGYDSNSGIFTWIKHRKSTLIGKPVGTVSKQTGYVVIGLIFKGIKKTNYQSHRLAWLYVYGVFPDGDIDHINRVRTDNRICNLRVCSRAENRRNTYRPDKNTSGFKGVSFVKENNKWRARVILKRKTVFDKCFDNIDDANLAAIEARNNFHCEFARHA